MDFLGQALMTVLLEPVKEDTKVIAVVALGIVGKSLLHFAEIAEEVFTKGFPCIS